MQTDNHAVLAQEVLRQGLGPHTAEWPEVPEDLRLFLEGSFPGRCYAPAEENLEQHLVYSGQANLVATLRVIFEQQKAEALALDPDDDTALSVELDHPEQED
ncbi:hypothetical protein ACLBWX_01035 [Methylobacterium sp. M6A4_1b]